MLPDVLWAAAAVVGGGPALESMCSQPRTAHAEEVSLKLELS
jgi:hypothetical protein